MMNIILLIFILLFTTTPVVAAPIGSVSPASGTTTTETDLVTIVFNTAALTSSGSPYTTTVTVDAGAAGSVVLPVTINVNSDPGITPTTERVASGLTFPISVTSPPNDSRLFIVERAGKVKILKNGVVLPTPFIDISSIVDTQGEGGLTSIAFAPDYATSRAFYLMYTTLLPDPPLLYRTQITRYLASTGNPDIAATTGKELISIPQTNTNHNGGTITFGPDGMLYIGMGDGGGSGDPFDDAQQKNILLGKMLRINVNFTSFNDNYTVPGDNPFVGDGAYLPEIWALGLRNPFRFSFDRTTGALYIGDVGQSSKEEVDAVTFASAGGRNYGWDVEEGTDCYIDPDGGPDAGEPACGSGSLTRPIYEYTHASGCSITGGYVYRGSNPSIQGRYFFADWCANKIWSILWNGTTGITGTVTDHTTQLAPPVGSMTGIVGFGEDAAGELYIVSQNGDVFRIKPTVVVNTAPTNVDAGGPYTIVTSGSTTVTATASDDGLPAPPGVLSYSWSSTTGCTFNNASIQNPTVFSSSAPGSTCTLTFTASDGQLSTVDTAIVNIIAAPIGAERLCSSSGSSCLCSEPNQSPTYNAGLSDWVNRPGFFNFDDSPTATQCGPGNANVTCAFGSDCNPYCGDNDALTPIPIGNGDISQINLPSGHQLTQLLRYKGDGQCGWGPGTFHIARGTTTCLRSYRAWKEPFPQSPDGQEPQQKIITIGGTSITSSSGTCQCTAGFIGGCGGVGQPTCTCPGWCTGTVLIQMSMSPGLAPNDGSIGGGMNSSTFGFLPQASMAGSYGNGDDCKSNLCRFEICEDMDSNGIVTARARKVAVAPGNFTTQSCTPGGNGTNVSGTNCLARTGSIPHPDHWAWNPGNQGMTYLLTQNTPNMSAYVTYGISTQVPFNRTYWPGPACEVEGGC